MTMTNTQLVTALWVFVGLMWLIIGNWIAFMLIRMLRWKYLEMKYAPQWAAQTPVSSKP